MMNNLKALRKKRAEQKRAVVAVQVVVMTTVLIGFAALTVDIGMMYNARADLQKAADSAALAGASAYTSDEMLQVRLIGNDCPLIYDVVWSARNQIDDFAALNPTIGASATLIESADVSLGWIDVTSGTSSVQTGGAPGSYNAVQVITRRSSEGANGPIQFVFSQIFGVATKDASASATAAYDDRVAGFDPGKGPGYLLPFTIHEDFYYDAIVNGPDSFGFDANDKTVTSAPDGISEVRLFPHDPAPGNFGLLNIGTPNQGVDTLHEQIANGVPPEDVESEIGTSVLTFHDEYGDSVTYDMTGSPGLDVSLEPTIELRTGDVIAFLLHNVVIENGANSVYTITDIRFGRVMEIKLQTAVRARGFWVQPVSYAGPGVILDPSAPSTNGLAGQIVLVR